MEQGMRLNKFLSDAGVCSRREADRLVEAGRITVDGVLAVMGQKVTPDQEIAIDHKPIRKEEEKVGVIAVLSDISELTEEEKEFLQNLICLAGASSHLQCVLSKK